MQPGTLRLFAGLASVALAIVPAIAQAEWRQAETRHFVIYSDGRESDLADFAVEAEKFDAMLRRQWSVPADQVGAKLPIYIMPDSEAVSKLKGVPRGYLGGYYTAPLEGSYAISNREKSKSPLAGTPQEVLFHEYTHHFFTRHLPGAYPTWLFEGIAEYYSTATFDKSDGFTVGAVAKSRAPGLRMGVQVPIARILTGQLDGLNAQQRDVFYGRSWMFTHWLLSRPEQRQTLSNYLRDINAGLSLEEAATKNFGALDALDRELEKMVNKGFPAFTSKLPVEFDPAVTMTALDPIDSELVELQVRRRAEFEPAQTIASLQALADRAPERAGVLAELARALLVAAPKEENAEAEAAMLARAGRAADAALALDAKNVSANVTKGLVLLEQGDGAVEDETIAAARRHFVRANNADPEDARALYEFFRSFAAMGQRPTDNALLGLEAAYSKMPEIPNYRVALAFSLANQGKYDEALSLVRFLAFHPHMGESGKRLVQQIEEMRLRRSLEADEPDDADYEEE